jgi:predicted amidohydrolase YtcJ
VFYHLGILEARMVEKQRRALAAGLAVVLVAAVVWAAHGRADVEAQQPTVPAELIVYPEMVLYNGQVLTADRDDETYTVAQAVAIRDGKFLAIGSTAEIRRLAGPDTRQVNLNGGSVLPGFMDTHQHLHEYAMRWLGRDDRRRPIRFESLESGLQEISAMAAGKPPGEWIVTSTRPYSARAMTRWNLDTVTPDNPLSIELSTEEYIVNSLGLQALLKLSGPEVVGLVKDPKTGEPNGQLRDVAAGMMQYEVLPYPYPEIAGFKAILKKEMQLESSWGITTVTTRITSEALTALNEMHQEEGTLPIRWRVGLPFPHLNPRAEQYFHRLGNMDRMGDDVLRINGISFFSIDSAIGRGGAWTSRPKRRLLPGDLSGQTGVDRKVNLPLIPLANKYGWSVKSIHSAGDMANTVLLDAYRATNGQRGIADRRFGIDHGPMLTAEHARVIGQLGVIPSIQAKYVFSDDNENLIHQYGPEALHTMTPVKTLIDAGIKVAGGADTGEEPFGHPLWNMEKMVTRTDEQGRMWGGREAISRKVSLLTYTRWAARYSHDEERLGSIEPGKIADFVVLGDNYLTVPEAVLSDLPIRMTVVGGRIVYDRERDGVIRAPTRAGRPTEGE